MHNVPLTPENEMLSDEEIVCLHNHADEILCRRCIRRLKGLGGSGGSAGNKAYRSVSGRCSMCGNQGTSFQSANA